MNAPLPSLASVAAASVLGRTDALRTAVEAALDGGVGPEPLRETLLMVALFAGYPRTLDTLAVAVPLVRARYPAAPEPEAGLPDDDGARRAVFRTRGRALFGAVYGDADEQVLAGLLDLDPELPGWILEDAYGRVLARRGLTAAVREVLAVVMLAALGQERQLVGHVRGALRCGATPGELRAALAAAGALLPPPMVALVEAELAD